LEDVKVKTLLIVLEMPSGKPHFLELLQDLNPVQNHYLEKLTVIVLLRIVSFSLSDANPDPGIELTAAPGILTTGVSKRHSRPARNYGQVPFWFRCSGNGKSLPSSGKAYEK
jgi:hypothetical protein